MLKRLELVGFKSFNQKAVLDFPQGITVIVGPNGSGKSNIVDAIKWILGERESKNLRGDSAEDLIFSGNSSKTRLGLAQASLYLDNSNQLFPIEYNDLVITRKISRDGTGEILLNKTEARLKDIINIFAQSRLGAKGLTIINQGNSDLFVKVSPKERRAMIEEMLGLKQYQIKKHEADLKLKSTQFNLEKSKITIEELLPRLKLLRRQAEKWSQRVNLLSELNNLEKNYFALKANSLLSSRNNLEEKIKSIDQKIKDETLETNKGGQDDKDDFIKLIKNLRYMVGYKCSLAELALTIDNFLKKHEYKNRARLQVREIESNVRSLEIERNKLLLEKDKNLWEWQRLGNLESYIGFTVEKSFSEKNAEQRITRIKHEISIIGETDPAIIKEAEETENRYKFLSDQVKDLEKATLDLNILTMDLDQQVNSKFQKYIGLVNNELEKHFHSIFNEGKAKLITNTEEIEIDINLPRKGVKSLDALSGGEKSLVSLAVLFSLISVTPPPFLILDEVDAALDENNSRCFADLVKSFSQKTQFVVVTHNRSVMEIADLLYGITMGADGTSKILSLKLST